MNIFSVNAENLPNCKWDNRNGTPCTTITKTNNTSKISESGVYKTIINKQDIVNSGANSVIDILKTVSGLDIYQSGPAGQQASIFTRGSESNHTMILLNGVAINDQSATNGFFDFGQDFIQTIQQIEIYKGSSGAQFGPSAIAGAINFITAIDYTNQYSISGFDGRNSSLDTNFTDITDNGWHLNIKGAANQSDTGSAKAAGNENDDATNFQINLNAEKLINDNTKIKSTIYTRQTRAKYDGSATDETGYVADNKMIALQTGINKIYQNKEDNLIFHYHNYDREYKNSSYLDEYYSSSLTVKGESKIDSNENFSFGYGSEYKYDWGNFENRGSYTASTKGHVNDLALFANAGYKISKNQTLSFYARSDNHSTAGRNETYKLNYTQVLGQFKFGGSHSTGLRNPSLYELYGSDNYGIGGNTNLAPEKSRTNELFGEYIFSEKLKFTSTAYRATILDRILSNSGYTAHENTKIDLNQEGLESELTFNGENQVISIFTNFSKSKKTNGSSQLRRPDITYGSNYYKKFVNSPIGPFNMNLNYKFTGKHLDTSGKVKSTNLIDMSASKNLYGSTWNINISNLLNERYEKPATYSQDGRQLRIGVVREY
ncbi:TonB-dependent receptor plug domain-containing protein [Candidatus Pelagibacter ubique]|nr:TonB-dependent receptor plug domain-containing protein [Candidatus Pelagibacter ubique]